jgi:hypothetical protein
MGGQVKGMSAHCPNVPVQTGPRRAVVRCIELCSDLEYFEDFLGIKKSRLCYLE